MRGWILAAVLTVVAIAPVCFLAYYYMRDNPVEKPVASVEFEKEQAPDMQVGAVIEVKAIKVIDGFRFDVFLDNGKWVEAHLPVAAKTEATEAVVELLRKATPPSPSVTLRRRVHNYWIVDLHLTIDDKRISVTEYLRDKGLLL